MAAKLRSAVGSAARRVVSEKLLIVFRGPSPNPAAAAEVDLLSKKAHDAEKRRWVVQFAESLVEEQKKRYQSQSQDWVAVPFFTTLSFVALFVAGNRLGYDHGTRMYEAQPLEEKKLEGLGV